MNFDIKVSDRQLQEINTLPFWYKMTGSDGKSTGRGLSMGEVRTASFEDNRIMAINNVIPLKGMKVLEPGCLEGYLTLGMIGLGATVTSFDVRPINVLKTYARGLAYGLKLDVGLSDAITMHQDFDGQKFDLIAHLGVFYHLKDPVEHLFNISQMAKYLALETHINMPSRLLERFTHRGVGYQGHTYKEHGFGEVFSGVDTESFWLTKDSILFAAENAGLKHIVTLDDANENKEMPRKTFIFENPNA